MTFVVRALFCVCAHVCIRVCLVLPNLAGSSRPHQYCHLNVPRAAQVPDSERDTLHVGKSSSVAEGASDLGANVSPVM